MRNDNSSRIMTKTTCVRMCLIHFFDSETGDIWMLYGMFVSFCVCSKRAKQFSMDVVEKVSSHI